MTLRDMKRVYVAGPYTRGDVAENVAAAVRTGDLIAEMGGAPFIPHLSHFWHMRRQHEYEFWIEQDLTWLRQCDALYRMAGESQGADIEMAEAERLGLPVFTKLADVWRWLKGRLEP